MYLHLFYQEAKSIGKILHAEFPSIQQKDCRDIVKNTSKLLHEITGEYSQKDDSALSEND